MRSNRHERHEALIGLAEALAKSGVSKLVLHAWERRYGLEPAERSDTGRRFYTPEQVERLRLLKICSNGGFRIGALVEMSTEALSGIEEQLLARQALGEILEAVRALDSERLHALLQGRAAAEPPEQFIRMTVLPLMREIGTLWAAGDLTIAAEHMTTAQIKRILGSLFDNCPPPRDDAFRLVATTPERQEHDIGALVATLLARCNGWNALFLGANLPAAEIAEAAHRRGARCVCLSALTGRRATLGKQLRDLRARLQPLIDIWIGGAAYAGVAPIAGVTYMALDGFLKRLTSADHPFPFAV